MKRILSAAALSLLAMTAGAETEFEASGRVGAEIRLFPQSPAHSGQYTDSNLSLLIEPEFFWSLGDGDDMLVFKPFLRLDQHDEERTHGDIRELLWTHVGDGWDLKAGIGKVFWGVTEFQHLVDTVNQDDAIEDIDGEDKLGQPMIQLSLIRDWGILDLFVLPGFRERTFPGEDGRLRSALVVDTNQASYESSAEELHTDLAVRWSHTIDIYDFGLHWFHGTNRDPLLQAGTGSNGQPVLTPYYEQMDQLGLDLQATLDAWLWKLELLWRDGQSDNYWAAQGGFEYTLTGVADSNADLGLLLEYGWDERGTGGSAINQNDLFFGTRLALNDAASSELLAGVGYDLDYHSKSLVVEASRRLGSNWKLSLDARLFSNHKPAQAAYGLRKDDHIQVTLEYYY